jgi:hypothetical protein
MQIRWKKRKRSLIVTVKAENEFDDKMIEAAILILSRYIPQTTMAYPFKPPKPMKVVGTIDSEGVVKSLRGGALPPRVIW